MPIYEYRCEKCEALTEAWQKVSDEALKDCPNCEAKGTLVKAISSTHFALKGTGWYTTDYKKSGGSDGAKK